MLKPSLLLRNIQWSTTLNLPKSTFPPRAIEAARPSYLRGCTEELYAWQVANRRADKPFVLHDGPPYANGSLHIGHALNKTLKDIICRFQISQGKRVHYRPGWDCHGLPIEIKALQEKSNYKYLSPGDIRDAARQLATATVEEQKKGFQEWGILGDWDNAYRTMDKDFEIKQLRVFRNMVEKGLIYRQFKPVHWSPSSGTALAEAELEYDDQHISRAAFIKYKLEHVPPPAKVEGTINCYALIWTTMPWTLPANRAIAYHENIRYCAFRVKDSSDVLLVATARLEEALQRAQLSTDDVDIVSGDILGSDLFQGESTLYHNTFRPAPDEDLQPMLHADFVSEDSGTGLVHMAPGHGPDDYNICRKYDIEPFAPLDDGANFTAEAYPQNPGLLEGKNIVPEGVQIVLDHLKTSAMPNTNLVWAEYAYTHKSPIDWRTKQPTIIRATAQWFAEVDTIKDQALRASEAVTFIPKSGKSRLQGFVNGRSQWCISRQRAWGVPIPAVYGSNGEAVMTSASVEHIINVIEDRGIDAWWGDAADDAVWIAPGLPEDSYTRGRDTMDVWFDSGTTWTQIPHREGEAPADVYLEGTDQHRGWFQSSLLTHVAQQFKMISTSDTATVTPKDLLPMAPFKTLITHGFILDAVGKKMSKSIGNVISPDEIMSGALLPPLKKHKGQKGAPTQLDAMGPDALRLWAAMSDYTKDVTISDTVLKAVNGALHKYRITFKWLLGALNDFDAGSYDDKPLKCLTDIIALAHLKRTETKVHEAYTAHDFAKATNAINIYVNIELSSFYLETIKDPLYAGPRDENLRVQQTCFEMFQSLLHMLKPVLPLLVTEVIDYAPEALRGLLQGGSEPFLAQPWKPDSTIPAQYLQVDEDLSADQILTAIEPLFAIHATIKALQEEARNDKKLRSGLECSVCLHDAPIAPALRGSGVWGRGTPAEENERLNVSHTDMLAEMFVVSNVALNSSGQEEHSDSDWCYSRKIQVNAGVSSTEAGGMIDVLVEVKPPRNEKCPRCWRCSLEKKAQQKSSSAVCGRCEQVLHQKGIDLLAEP